MWKVFCAAGVASVVFFTMPQSQELDLAGVKNLVEGLGYETKALNTSSDSGKYEFTVTRPTLNIPMGVELSGSKHYVWLTVFLGPAPEATSPKNAALLLQNSKVQPTFFYTSSSKQLFAAYALENRGLTPALAKRAIEKLADDMESTHDDWK